MDRTHARAAAVVLAAALAAPPALAAGAETSTLNVTVPLDRFRAVPCLGESVHLTGTLHFVIHETFDENGGYRLHYQAQPMNVTGVSASGLLYRGTGITQTNDGVSAVETSTFVSNFRLIGQADAPDLHLHTVAHYTITPAGEIVVDFVEDDISCD